MASLEEKLHASRETTQTHIANLRAEKNAEIDSLKNTLADRKRQIAYYDKFNEVEKHEIKAEIEHLKGLIQVEKDQKDAAIAQLEKEKNERMEKMRKEMLLEVKQVKTDMLNFTEDKLQGTTRLTIKQNKQLTSELEFQSKQTENLIYQNGTMATEIKSLTKDLKLHQEVEKELAKRSHFCQKVIQKYQDALKNLR